MKIEIRDHPELLETLSSELSAHNTVELKVEKDRDTGEERIVAIRIDRKMKVQSNV